MLGAVLEMLHILALFIPTGTLLGKYDSHLR